jgi:hypothetical protein
MPSATAVEQSGGGGAAVPPHPALRTMKNDTSKKNRYDV